MDAWNPGLESTIPEELRHLSTVLRPENVFTTLAEARELRGFTGLDYADLAVFRPSRLLLHEVLIRVSADLTVPDGERIEDLGINFRDMTSRIMARLQPRLAQVEALYEQRRHEVSKAFTAELATGEPQSPSLARLVSVIHARHGRLWGPREVIVAIAAGMACNAAVAQEIGGLVEPWFREAAAAEGFRTLPAQEHPVVFNTKGASASGKTSIRFLQRELAGRLGLEWRDFALISPDIWRKQLLDYGSLGEAYKYAGAFTGEELRIVDQKLDHYIAAKAAAGRMTHLLIDRFRFDSFAPDSDEPGSNLLTRFGHVVYLFFMITPPASLVERAWNRGLEVGRYKAVDDTLAHSVEAYAGMPELFFTWVQRADKRVHFEFLDNEVPAGERPRTVAFGWNDRMTIFDKEPLLDIERFRRIDVDAKSPDALFPAGTPLAAELNRGFLDECVRRLPQVDFGAAPPDPAARLHTVGNWEPDQPHSLRF